MKTVVAGGKAVNAASLSATVMRMDTLPESAMLSAAAIMIGTTMNAVVSASAPLA
jgi:hypothetical protein